MRVRDCEGEIWVWVEDEDEWHQPESDSWLPDLDALTRIWGPIRTVEE